jgi:hypothetical protein
MSAGSASPSMSGHESVAAAMWSRSRRTQALTQNLAGPRGVHIVKPAKMFRAVLSEHTRRVRVAQRKPSDPGLATGVRHPGRTVAPKQR